METRVSTMDRVTNRTRTAGLAAIGGGLLLLGAAGMLPFYPGADQAGAPGYRMFFALFTSGAILLAMGAAGSYLRYREVYGTLGVLGSALATIGALSMAVGGLLSFLYAGPVGEATSAGGFAFTGVVVALLGSALVGIALWRAGVATLAAILFVFAAAAFVLGLLAGPTVAGVDLARLAFVLAFSLGWIGLGNDMRRGPAVDTERTATPAA